MRRLGWIALGTVVVQGLLGGITVLYFLPAPVSIGHAGLAHLFFTLIVSLGVLTSPGWLAAYRRPEPLRDRTLLRLVLLVPAVVYGQILLGAVMRHTGAGLAIPDFPLAFGQLVPPSWSAAIGVHFAHRVGAAVVTVIVFAAASRVLAPPLGADGADPPRDAARGPPARADRPRRVDGPERQARRRQHRPRHGRQPRARHGRGAGAPHVPLALHGRAGAPAAGRPPASEALP